MRLVETRSIQPGAVLAKSIYNEKGQILLNEGASLTSSILKRLVNLGISFLYVEDERTEDIHYEERIPRELKTEAIQSIQSTFRQIQTDQTVSNYFVMEKASKKFMEIVRSLETQLQETDDLLSILSDVFSYDDYIFTHSFNVTLYSIAIGTKLKLPRKELETLGLGALLHDVGKMNVPKKILLKPAKLTNEEFEYIKRHPVDGFEILRRVHTFSLIVAHCAYQHHERLDGSGYPRGIKDKDIHLFGKILAVADVFDAVTSNRVYRKAMLPSDGLEILFAGAGTLFDANIVDTFRKSVAMYPVGITVQLSDGRTGVVAGQNAGVSDRPIVRVIEEQGVPVTPYEVNLLNELNVVITECHTQMV